MEIKCLYCGKIVEAERPTKKYCSTKCASRYRNGYPKTRICLVCGTSFKVLTQGDCARKYCSDACSKKQYAKQIMNWKNEHPEKEKEYRKNRVSKNPGVWREKYRLERIEIIKLLGSRCVVCGVSNQNWLHVDYIPTTRNKPYRHPRHLSYIKKHLSDFRLLCANHHYELTLTGKIEGSCITQ